MVDDSIDRVVFTALNKCPKVEVKVTFRHFVQHAEGLQLVRSVFSSPLIMAGT
jgi:hypothetical protein